jgi:hypothetical protein
MNTHTQEYGTIIAIIDNTTVIEADDGTLYVSPATEADEVGELLELAYALPLDSLPESQQEPLRAAVAAIPEEIIDALREGVILHG